jgi:hypothetical protein
MNSYKTMVEAIADLQKKGYVDDLNLQQNHIQANLSIKLHPEDFHVDAFYRFEENTDPDEQAIIYAISAPQLKIKGILVNAYGIYSEAMTDEMTKKLNVHE